MRCWTGWTLPFGISIFFWMMLQIRQRWKFVRTVIRSFTIKCSFNQQCFIELVRRNITPLHCKIRQEVISITISLGHEALHMHHTLLGLQWLVVQHLKLHFNSMMVLTSLGKDIFIKKKEIHKDFLKWDWMNNINAQFLPWNCSIKCLYSNVLHDKKVTLPT